MLSLSFSLPLSLGLIHYSQVDILGVRYKFVDLGAIYEQMLFRNVKRFRGGLVIKARRLMYRSALGLRAIKKKQSDKEPGRPPSFLIWNPHGLSKCDQLTSYYCNLPATTPGAGGLLKKTDENVELRINGFEPNPQGWLLQSRPLPPLLPLGGLLRSVRLCSWYASRIAILLAATAGARGRAGQGIQPCVG